MIFILSLILSVGFENLASDDQIALLKGSTIETMFLRSAQIYNEQAIECQLSFSESKLFLLVFVCLIHSHEYTFAIYFSSF